MTFRAKPVVKRSRHQWESQDRRNFLTNLAFGLVVVAALLILAVAVALSWYNDHLAPVGSVAGETITKDQLRDRAIIEDWRLVEQLRRVSTQAGSGRITAAEAAGAQQFINQQRDQIEAIALERIIDNRIQAQLAAEEGVTVSDADIDAKLVEEATIPEARHAWVIEVEPAVTDGELEPTAAQIAEARTKAAGALADIRGGKDWEEVAMTVSTDTATREQGGDLGWIEADDRSLDEAFVNAVFELEADAATEVLEGDDGVFRIGRVTEVEAETVDELYQTKMANENVDIAKYREVVRGDVVRTKLEDKVVAGLLEPGPQRRVGEIVIAEGDPDAPPEAVKVRHILYSPNDEPSPEVPLPNDDPAWDEAEEEARAAYDALVEDPTQFDTLARTESDEQQARGTAGSGGKLGPFYGPDSGLPPEFEEAILEPGLEDGDVLEPVRSGDGWHVFQIMYHPPVRAQLEKIQAQADAGEDFGQLARDFSEGRSAGTGGDIGWIARGQLDEASVDAIFAAPIGKTSEIVEVEGEGSYLYKVFEEEVRELEGRQLEDLRATAFSDWYQEKKAAVAIDRGDLGV